MKKNLLNKKQSKICNIIITIIIFAFIALWTAGSVLSITSSCSPVTAYAATTTERTLTLPISMTQTQSNNGKLIRALSSFNLSWNEETKEVFPYFAGKYGRTTYEGSSVQGLQELNFKGVQAITEYSYTVYNITYNLTGCTVDKQPAQYIQDTTLVLTFTPSPGYKMPFIDCVGVGSNSTVVQNETNAVMTITNASKDIEIIATATAVISVPTLESGTYVFNDIPDIASAQFGQGIDINFKVKGSTYSWNKIFVDSSSRYGVRYFTDENPGWNVGYVDIHQIAQSNYIWGSYDESVEDMDGDPDPDAKTIIIETAQNVPENFATWFNSNTTKMVSRKLVNKSHLNSVPGEVVVVGEDYINLQLTSTNKGVIGINENTGRVYLIADSIVSMSAYVHDNYGFVIEIVGSVGTDLVSDYWQFSGLTNYFVLKTTSINSNASNAVSFNQGYEQGSKDKQQYGNQQYLKGKADGIESANTYSFTGLFTAIFDVPIQTLFGLLNIEILGVNLYSFFTGLLTLALIIFVIKLVI